MHYIRLVYIIVEARMAVLLPDPCPGKFWCVLVWVGMAGNDAIQKYTIYT